MPCVQDSTMIMEDGGAKIVRERSSGHWQEPLFAGYDRHCIHDLTILCLHEIKPARISAWTWEGFMNPSPR